MPLFMLGFMVIAGLATVAAMKLWFDISQLRADVQRLSRTQDALIDIVSTKMLEDDALSREILALKTPRSPSR